MCCKDCRLCLQYNLKYTSSAVGRLLAESAFNVENPIRLKTMQPGKVGRRMSRKQKLRNQEGVLQKRFFYLAIMFLFALFD